MYLCILFSFYFDQFSSRAFRKNAYYLAAFSGLLNFFKLEVAALLGAWAPMAIFIGAVGYTHKALRNHYGNANLVKSLYFNQAKRHITISYYNSSFLTNTAIFEAAELGLEYVPNSDITASHYILQNDTHKFILPIVESNTIADQKLLKEIFNHSNKDDSVETVLLRRKNLIELHNDSESNSHYTLDLLLRSKMLEEQGQLDKSLSAEEAHKRILSIPDSDVEQYKAQTLNVLNNTAAENELPAIEELLSTNGLAKAQEVTKYLAEKFDVSTVYHLKNVAEYEMNQVADNLQIKIEDVERVFMKIRNH